MRPTLPVAWLALPVLALLCLDRNRSRAHRPIGPLRSLLDTVADWPPAAARVLNLPQRQPHAMLEQAMRAAWFLGQVPLSRFLRVPARRPHTQGLLRAGSLSADLLLCNAHPHVLDVVCLRAPRAAARRDKLHERLTAVVHAAGLRLVVRNPRAWHDIETVSAEFCAMAAPIAPSRPPASENLPADTTSRQDTPGQSLLQDPANKAEASPASPASESAQHKVRDNARH